MAARNSQQDTDTTGATDVVDPIGNFDVTTLRGIGSFDDAVALLTETYGEIEDATNVIGSGFRLGTDHDKFRLIDTAFIIVRMTFPQSDKYKDADTGEYVHYAVLHVVTANNEKIIIMDGGVGIYQQCEEWSVRTGKQGGLVVRGGLRVSTYDLPDGSGEGTTYYLNV